MKKILGLDLGTTSIGWALVHEAELENEKSQIIKVGVRVNPLTVDEISNFERGKSITTNADRTLKRSMRRNLQRYKLRRENLIELLKKENFIDNETLLSEHGNSSTFDTYRLRAKAASAEISLKEFARVLLMINKKRGYKSSRKIKPEEDGIHVDSMDIAKKLYLEDLTPAQLCLNLMESGKKHLPEFYRSDLQHELDMIWDFQKKFHPEILTDAFKEQIRDKGKANTSKIFLGKYSIYTAENKGKDKILQSYRWRVDALSQQLSKEELAYVISDVNGSISGSSGYLGAISDRSKILHFQRLTVGQFLMQQLDRDPNCSLKNQVFYRQDYMDEFDRIWETQRKYHPELTDALKKEIRDIIIFYQRRLKSQKGLVSFCEFERRIIKVDIQKSKITGSRVCPRSSPLFQEFKIWQNLNNVEIRKKGDLRKRSQLKKRVIPESVESDQTPFEPRPLHFEEKEILFRELSYQKELSQERALELLFENHKDFTLNFKKLEGNHTQAALMKAYETIIDCSGHGEYNFSKMKVSESLSIIHQVFSALGYNTEILSFDSSIAGDNFHKQKSYQLWHLLYSFEADNSLTGTEKLVQKISELCAFPQEHAKILAGVNLLDDYSSLSAKAIRKILPFLKEGNLYDVACLHAGYKHSKSSLTEEELNNKIYKNHLDILPKNSLRNPVVEKILNQMIHVVNAIVEKYGRPDEVRIELARELKKNAKEREEMTKSISASTTEHERIRSLLQKEFGFSHVSRNDIIRYKLYEELKGNGYKTLYSNTYIPREKLFSKEVDIEHIIPQSRLFDDSFSNKTLEIRSVNIEKSNQTAYDYVLESKGEQGLQDYLSRIDDLLKNGSLTPTKVRKLKMKGNEIPNDFIERDLRDSQYIARMARTLLLEMFREVVSTSGFVTGRLRSDWGLIDVLQELNWEKYDMLGLTEIIEGRDGQRIRRIKDWTKRNDHRHHAMDALTIAFTKRNHIQYLNHLNARSDNSSNISHIEKKELSRDERGKLCFKPPIVPLDDFRREAKKQLECTLVSIKAKNKVVTRNINRFKKGKESGECVQLTPRGQLHLETVYGQCKKYKTKEVTVNAAMTEELIQKVCKKAYKEALTKRLAQFGNDPKKAFTGKNSLEKNPIFLNDLQLEKIPQKVKIVEFENIYTIRKEVEPSLNVEKVVDSRVKKILQDRLKTYGNDPKKAFVNLDENPIWLNEAKKIAIKRVTITGISNALPLHDKKNKEGAFLLDDQGRKQAVDFVSTGNNHHIAIYKDEKGGLQEKVVSFFEATMRALQKLPIIDKSYNQEKGWEFLFSMKQNEYFVFPNEKLGFYPKDVDLFDASANDTISKYLFRVQKISSKDYYFRHHLESSVENVNTLNGTTWKRIRLINGLDGAVKVRINHLGEIISTGEY